MTITTTATYKLTGWKGDQLKRRVVEVLGDYAKALDEQLKEEIRLVQFSWPGITYRKNGTIEGSPRDIVDTGAFLRSQQRNRVSATEVRYTWGNSEGVNYAGIILNGKGNNYPSRNWIEPALKNLPMDRYFAAAWAKVSK